LPSPNARRGRARVGPHRPRSARHRPRRALRPPWPRTRRPPDAAGRAHARPRGRPPRSVAPDSDRGLRGQARPSGPPYRPDLAAALPTRRGGGVGPVTQRIDCSWAVPGSVRGGTISESSTGPSNLPENLEWLRSRNLKGKRSLALHESVIGADGVERFFRWEPAPLVCAWRARHGE